MIRIGNTRTIADIEFFIEAPSLGSDVTAWQAHSVHYTRDRHRYIDQSYSYAFEVLDLRLKRLSLRGWHVVNVSELWRFTGARAETRGSKSLRVLQGKPADVLSWMRQCRDQKLDQKLTDA